MPEVRNRIVALFANAFTHRIKATTGTLPASLIGVLAILVLALGPEPVLAKMDYTFEGKLQVELNDGRTVPISGAQIRVKREGGPGVGRKHAETGPEGDFNGTWKFARDRNGALPGGKPIRFEIQARLRDEELKIRKGGWFKKNWITIATVEGEGGGRFPLDEITIDSGKARKLASLWWAHQEVLQALDDQGVGLTNKLVVIYPNKFIFKPNADFYLFRVRLTEKRWKVGNADNQETIIHEMMHQWDVNHMKGERSLICVADAHHKSHDKWASSRCSGFMEGFAEAMAQQLNHEVFSNGEPEPVTMAALRNGDVCWDSKEDKRYPITNIGQAQRTDCGWENFLTFIMTEDKFSQFADANRSCEPTTVSEWEMLEALKREAPRKANWVQGKATFTWFTDILQRQVDGFDAWDARYYNRLGDPSNTLAGIQDELCDSRHAGGGQSIVIDGSVNSGGTDYVLRDGGQIEQVSGRLDGHKVTIQANDQVNDTSARGRVGSGKDGFRVNGELPVISLSQPVNAAVAVNGKPYYMIVIDGSAADGATDYALRADSQLRQVSGQLAGYDVTIQSNDDVRNNTAEGHVGGGKDGFIAVGEVPRITLDNPGNAEVYVNGLYYHTVVIDGSAASGSTDYTVHGTTEIAQVSGQLAGHDVTIQSNDEVSDGRAQGHVGGGKDGFVVMGPKPRISLDNPDAAVVYVNGEKR